MWWKEVILIRGSCAPCLASLFALLLPMMFAWALPFLMMILCVDFLMAPMICVMRSLFGWLFWKEGCWMWFCRWYMLLRLSIKMNVSVLSDVVCSMANNSACNSILKMLGYLGSLVVILA